MIATMTDDPKATKHQAPDDPMYSIAKRICSREFKDEYIYCLEEDKFYIYEKGYWHHIYENVILDKVSRNIRINNFPLNRRKQIIENMKSIKYHHLERFNWAPLLNLINGMVNPLDGWLSPHESILYSTVRLNYNYCEKELGKDNSFPMLWIKTLNEIFEDNKEKINILQEFFGYCLTKDVSREKSLLLLGESRSGKSTILETLAGMMGEENYSSVSLEHLSNPQHTPLLINKMVNIDWDVSGGAEKYEANFKIITSGEPITVNQKFIPTFKFRPYCKLIMAANKFPRITDHSSAFFKRLILLPCERVFEPQEQNPLLKEQLKKELPLILNWSIEGLQRMVKRGNFEVGKKFMTDAIEELREESNPVDIFFRENIATDVMGSAEIEKQDLYIKYVDWCKTNGNAAMANNKFGATVYSKYSKYTPKTTSNAQTGKRVWKNLKYKEVKHGEVVQGWQT